MKLNLNYKKIVDKKFETIINGYSPTQVDIFLDKICSDYLAYEAEIANLKTENNKLKAEKLKIENLQLKNKEIDNSTS